MCAVLGAGLLASSAAFGQAAVPRGATPKLADFAANNLSALDGSTLALSVQDSGLVRKISVPDGRGKKTLFVLLNDSLGTVSEGTDGKLNVTGIFRINQAGITVAYGDGRSEVMTLNGSGGVSMAMNMLGGEVICRSWYPAGHSFNLAERKGALAEYARTLGIAATGRDRSAKPGCALAAAKGLEAQPRPAGAPAAVKDAAKGSAILGRVLARALIFYARQSANNGPPPSSNIGDGFENFYANFLAAHEGGYTENDGNGSPANFGINQGANPDIDVLGLTQAEAKQILHDRYWVASGAHRLPAALAAIHGDTAINMGVGAANDLLAQSGGDARKYLDLRGARYRSIAAPDSDKAKYLPVWLGRNEDLRNYAGADAFAEEEQGADDYRSGL